MEIKEKLKPCLECGKVDKIRIGVTSAGCVRCGRFCVAAEFSSVAYAWNHNNSKEDE